MIGAEWQWLLKFRGVWSLLLRLSVDLGACSCFDELLVIRNRSFYKAGYQLKHLLPDCSLISGFVVFVGEGGGEA